MIDNDPDLFPDLHCVNLKKHASKWAISAESIDVCHIVDATAKKLHGRAQRIELPLLRKISLHQAIASGYPFPGRRYLILFSFDLEAVTTDQRKALHAFRNLLSNPYQQPIGKLHPIFMHLEECYKSSPKDGFLRRDWYFTLGVRVDLKPEPWAGSLSANQFWTLFENGGAGNGEYAKVKQVAQEFERFWNALQPRFSNKVGDSNACKIIALSVLEDGTWNHIEVSWLEDLTLYDLGEKPKRDFIGKLHVNNIGLRDGVQRLYGLHAAAMKEL
jgi:hypothetical protein